MQRANELLKHHHGKAIDFFKVHFSLNSEHASSIDEWVKFAIEADAREIVLNFTEGLQAPSSKIYKFPYWYFIGTVTGKVPYLRQLTLTKCSFKVLPNSYGLSSLRSLYLKCVKLSNDDVANLLSCCSRLSWLRLNSCTGFQELTISHTSDELRYLRVDCDRDFDVTILDSNLQTFEYYPYDWYSSDVKFEGVPRLSRVSAFCPIIGTSASLDTVLRGPIIYLCSSLETLFFSLKAPFEVC